MKVKLKERRKKEKEQGERKIGERKNERRALWFRYQIIRECYVGCYTADYYYYYVILLFCYIILCFTAVLLLGCSWPCLAVVKHINTFIIITVIIIMWENI
jgi:hypothetical membrane protein